MPRELRKRASRPNYAALLNTADDENADEVPARPVVVQDPDSGSDFAPEEPDQGGQENGDDSLPLSDASADEDMLENISGSDRESFIASKKTKKKNAAKKSAAQTIRTPRHSLSVPSIHHRHRAIPLYNKDGMVERLVKKPTLFTSSELAFTNSWGSSRTVLSRVGKAWGHNVGPGPLWELLEDRGWYGEGNEGATESERRPRVYTELRIHPQYGVINAETAKQFLFRSQPIDQDQLKCSFGPFGSQQQARLSRFSRIAMENYISQSSAHVFNAGAPVWGLDWCPIHPDDRTGKQYLAVAPLPSSNYSPQVGMKIARPNAASIQIWSLNPPTDINYGNQDISHGKQSGSMNCEMVLCVAVGPAHEIKWCPLPSNEPFKDPHSHSSSPRRFGLLAGAFEDGSVSIYSVPYPSDVASYSANTDEPIYVKMTEPLVRFELEETSAWSIDWGNSEVIAVGCSNGYIAVFDVAEALKNGEASEALLPTFYASTHQSAVRSVSWVRCPSLTGAGDISSKDPHVIISASYDGLVAATDIRAPCGNVIYRTRDVLNAMCYSTYAGGPLSIDQGQVKAISFAPVMLNKGHIVTEPDGPVWHIGASDYHSQIAVGVADGTCQTTNSLRNMRKGGTVPHISHIIYQLDYNRETREFRMLERFFPKEVEKGGGTRFRAATKGVAAWSPEVGVTRVCWNNGNGLANASLLASATASGLCRVDWLTGRWAKSRVPYDGIEGIRAEVEADEEMDEESD
ncbi:hypothetical protein BDY19DRAFT_996057 [Irpex rosettiformis]|uniref:Uncharacterized protein n=1 Tax=Irpex rosettiformis TaxID=378272 RepID=A0ACB8TVS7_9APHY|nr:hypothetical protein BDY19DRAFT_996057 [Irpex rosettiformis]